MKAVARAGSKTSKITISVWNPVWSKLEKRLEVACLKRDAYIDALIDRELDYLQEEMPIANSEGAEQFVGKQLRALLGNNFTPLSIALRPEVAKKLESVCAVRRIVRDAFFNRLFLFLALGPGIGGKLLFRNLTLDGESTDWVKSVWKEYKHDGPFFENVFEPFQAHLDPLWPIRAYFEYMEDYDKPVYVDWTDPETGRTVKMNRWFPDHIHYLPDRFYTAVLTDHALRRSTSNAPTRHSAQGRAGVQNTEPVYHNLYGLNCYLPNFHVRGHPDQLAVEKASNELLADI